MCRVAAALPSHKQGIENSEAEEERKNLHGLFNTKNILSFEAFILPFCTINKWIFWRHFLKAHVLMYTLLLPLLLFRLPSLPIPVSSIFYWSAQEGVGWPHFGKIGFSRKKKREMEKKKGFPICNYPKMEGDRRHSISPK